MAWMGTQVQCRRQRGGGRGLAPTRKIAPPPGRGGGQGFLWCIAHYVPPPPKGPDTRPDGPSWRPSWLPSWRPARRAVCQGCRQNWKFFQSDWRAVKTGRVTGRQVGCKKAAPVLADVLTGRQDGPSRRVVCQGLNSACRNSIN